MLELLITSSLLILVLCMIRLMLKGKINPRLQYALWLLVVLKLLPVTLLPGISYHPVKSQMSVMNFIAGNQLIDSGTIVNEDTDSDVERKNNHETRSETSTEEPADYMTATQSRFPVRWIWIAGMMIGGIWFTFVNLRFRKYLLDHRRPFEVENCFLKVYVVEGLRTPCISMIHFSNAIYITKEVSENPEQLAHVIKHEYCHYRHRDYIWTWVRCCYLIFYWFDPLVWLAAYLSKKDGELACDSHVIRSMNQQERLSYGKTLVDLAASQQKENVFCLVSGMADNQSTLKERIKQIVRQPKMIVSTAILLLAMIGITIVLTFTSAKEKEEMKEIDIAESGANENDIDSETGSEEMNQPAEGSLDEYKNIFEAIGKMTEKKVGNATINRYNGILEGNYITDMMNSMIEVNSMDDITEDVIKNGASSYYQNLNDGMSGESYHVKFGEFTGVNKYLKIEMTEKDSLRIDYEADVTKDNFTLALLLSDDTILYLKANTNDVYELPRGTSYIIQCGYKASGEFTIGFEEP